LSDYFVFSESSKEEDDGDALDADAARRVGGYEDVNDADRLCSDPAIH
jgi:hypothetical protein